MAVSKSILGMNARNYLYIRRYNSGRAKRNADDKLATKQALIKHHISVPKLLAKFYSPEEIKKFKWELPKEGFAIKPARGYAGGGILVIKSWDGKHAKSSSGKIYTKKQLESHFFDIFDGAYSLQYLPDKALIESLVTPSDFFKKIGALGVPDIRVIVFRKIPIMAMMRFPTRESHGKANLHMGAIGIGIDIRTGITTHAFYKNKLIFYFPESKKKISGIKIPMWHEILLLASRAAEVSKLGYAGIDMIIDEEEGPQVLEINARPGLSIQNVNLRSLRTRMERVEDMGIETPERAVEVAQSLFSEDFSDRVKSGPKILTVVQPVTLYGKGNTENGLRKELVLAKLDTGAYRTAIDENLAKKLQLSPGEKKVFIKSASGAGYRDTVKLTYDLSGRKIKTLASVVDRRHLKFPVIVGRTDLQGFLIKPNYGEYPDDDKENEENNP